jgi:predicted nuclease of predicted toxin-antitoxin system
MRLLLDESIPIKLRRSLPNHDVRTVVEMGWSGVKSGKLLALAADEFDAFVTVDKNLPYQQNLTMLPVAVIVMDAVSNELSALLPLLPSLEQALLQMKPRTYSLVSRVA